MTNDPTKPTVDVPSGASDVDVVTHRTHSTHVTASGLDAGTYGDILATAKTPTGDPVSSPDQLSPSTVVTVDGVGASLKGLEAAGLARKDPNAPGGWSFGEQAPAAPKGSGDLQLSQTTEQAMTQLEPHLQALGYDRAQFLSTLVAGSPQSREQLVKQLGARGVPGAGLGRFVNHIAQEVGGIEEQIARKAGGSADDVLSYAKSTGHLSRLRSARARLLMGDSSGYAFLAKDAASAGRMSGREIPAELLTTSKTGESLVDLRKYGLPQMRRATFDRMLASGELKALATKHGLKVRA